MSRRLALALAFALTACGGSGSSDSDSSAEVLDQQKAGEIALAMHSNGTTGYEYTIYPQLISAPASETCTIIELGGNCRKINCPEARSSEPELSAGTIHITAGMNTLDLAADYKGYTNRTTPSSFFEGGETLSFSAPGGSAAGFNVTVTAPSPLMATAPVDSLVTLSQSKDLPVSWTGTTKGSVIFEASIKADSNFIRMQCRFPGTATSGTVPAAAIMSLAPGSNYTVDLFSRDRAVVSSDGWSYAIEGRYHAGVKGTGAYQRPAVVQE